jgi:glutaminase
MAHSGMYDASGQWFQRIGVPPKSGVSGAVILVVPGVMGVCVFSPNLDENGNSVRGVKFAEMLSEKYALHPYEIPGAKKDLRGRERGAGVAVPAAAVSRSGALGANRQAPQTVLDASRVALDGVTGPTSGRVTGATTSPQVGGTPPSQHSGSGRHRISDTGPEL